jgi:hypothetical protein
VSPGLGQLVGALGDAPARSCSRGTAAARRTTPTGSARTLVAHAGWDPRAIASVMDALSRDQQRGGDDPNQNSYFDTHPTLPSARSARSSAQRRCSRRASRRSRPTRRHFLAKLDGLLCGDPAENGVIVEREFLHAPLDFRIAFPAKWEIENARQRRGGAGVGRRGGAVLDRSRRRRSGRGREGGPARGGPHGS